MKIKSDRCNCGTCAREKECTQTLEAHCRTIDPVGYIHWQPKGAMLPMRRLADRLREALTYRRLRMGEDVRHGDEVWYGGRWNPAVGYVGSFVDRLESGCVRRRRPWARGKDKERK